MNKILLEQLNRSKELMKINETVTAPPKVSTSAGYIYINGKKYKLQTKKAFVRIGIDILKALIGKDGMATLTVKHPISGDKVISKIRKSNFDKVLSGVEKNRKEITVRNEEGKEFYLVKA